MIKIKKSDYKKDPKSPFDIHLQRRLARAKTNVKSFSLRFTAASEIKDNPEKTQKKPKTKQKKRKILKIKNNFKYFMK